MQGKTWSCETSDDPIVSNIVTIAITNFSPTDTIFMPSPGEIKYIGGKLTCGVDKNDDDEDVLGCYANFPAEINVNGEKMWCEAIKGQLSCKTIRSISPDLAQSSPRRKRRA